MVGNYDGHLAQEGELITLRSADGQVVQRMVVGGQTSDVQRYLRITEVNYHPYDPVPGLGEPDDGSPAAADRFEFLELTNTGTAKLDVSNVRIGGGVEFVFPSGTSLAAGERLLVVADRTAFAARYGQDLPVAGQFTGTLSDAGQPLLLDNARQQTVQAFSYGSTDPWPRRAGGLGSSLAVADTAGDYRDPANWRASVQFGGSPGGQEDATIDRVVIHEVLSQHGCRHTGCHRAAQHGRHADRCRQLVHQQHARRLLPLPYSRGHARRPVGVRRC